MTLLWCCQPLRSQMHLCRRRHEAKQGPWRLGKFFHLWRRKTSRTGFFNENRHITGNSLLILWGAVEQTKNGGCGKCNPFSTLPRAFPTFGESCTQRSTVFHTLKTLKRPAVVKPIVAPVVFYDWTGSHLILRETARLSRMTGLAARWTLPMSQCGDAEDLYGSCRVNELEF